LNIIQDREIRDKWEKGDIGDTRKYKNITNKQSAIP
jgi:hypothetical protein